MVTKGLSLVIGLFAVALTIPAALGWSAGYRSVGFQGEVSRNASGHWVVQLALVHGGHRGPREHQDTMEWGTYHVTFRNLLREKEPSLQTAISITVPPRVPLDYQFYDGIGYYKIHKKKTSFKVANETCHEEGAHLVIINSKQEEDVIKGIVKESGADYAFIGLFREGEGKYQTVLGDPISSLGYVNWSGGKIEYNSGSNCVRVEKDGKLHHSDCDVEKFAICEVPL